MSQKQLALALACSALALCAGSGPALADLIGKYECNVVGTNAPEPLGDRSGHGLVNYQFSCFGVDGLLKGAVYSAIHVSEWDGPQGKFLLAGGVHRTAGGYAVTQMQEGISSLIMQDGKPVGSTSSGTAIFNLGTGTLSSLSGKKARFTAKTIGPGRFVLELQD
jgi:hypothetical protein